MATMHMIAKLSNLGLPVTEELPDGKWAHTPEYFKHRYSVRAPKKDITNIIANAEAAPKLTHPWEKLARKLTPAERIQLIAMLEDK